MRERELALVGDRVLRPAGLDVLDRVGRARRGLLPLQRRCHGALQALQDALLRAAGAHRNLRRLELQRVARLHAVALVHHQLRDERVGIRRIGDPRPVGGTGEGGGGDVGAAGGELRLRGALVGHRIHVELHAQGGGIGARQIELQPFGALRAEVVAGRQVERHHAQLAAGADLLHGTLGEDRRWLESARNRLRLRATPPWRREQLRARTSPHRTGFPLEYQPPQDSQGSRRGTEAVITAPTRNRMVG